jgi:hypothetical protein
MKEHLTFPVENYRDDDNMWEMIDHLGQAKTTSMTVMTRPNPIPPAQMVPRTTKILHQQGQ